MNERLSSFFLAGTLALAAAGCQPSSDRAGGPDGTGETGLKVHASTGPGPVEVFVADQTPPYTVATEAAIPESAQALHREARAKGQIGDFPAAIALLEQAIEQAPQWAYPRYDLAFTYLLQGKRKEALQRYQEVDRLEPGGFFTAKTALWTLQREAEGALPAGTYLSYVSLEYADPVHRHDLVMQMAQQLPKFPPILKEKALMVSDEAARLKLFDHVLTLQPDAETKGAVLLNKAAWLAHHGQLEEANRLAAAVRDDAGTTTSKKALAEHLLNSFSKTGDTGSVQGATITR